MKSKTGYIIGTLKKRNESLSQENDKLKDEVERLNVELSEAAHNIKTMQDFASKNQSELINKDNQIRNLAKSLMYKDERNTKRDVLLKKYDADNNRLSFELFEQTTETEKWKEKYESLLKYVRNIGITIVIFGLIILFTQYM
ncbi:hypothetical protein F362_gp74 [Enterobacter phage EcP1]|uniref:Uncharacterized protein n=1 Tax=Enterobacter phage EcP1 TaxID=942016 RepID=E9NIJ9_9CAUD|nr:hypothetical protein F362_gp74 [Enterobacter phage EcP1]ADU79225.1 hypothetical protein EcP1_gp74 [Enterobacter phage EcP1]